MMMQAAVGDEENVAARDLAVEDAAYVHAGLADQVTAQLEHDLRLGQLAPRCAARASRRLAPIGARSSGFSPGK